MMSLNLQGSNRTLDDHVEVEIAGCLRIDRPKSFFLFAGAGSGKTRSLVFALRYIRKENGRRLRLRGQRVAVVTYTNAACDEITQRIEFDSLFQVSTIHSFAWQLIGGHNTDIRRWLKSDLAATIAELEALEAKGRSGTKASIARMAQIESKRERLARLDGFKSFTYNPSGDNREINSLNHSEVIGISSSFLLQKPLLQNIVVQQYPFFLIDEGQDTNRYLIDALFATEAKHREHFCLGFFGDTMQRIYNDGKERIEADLPETWQKPIKRLNYRCPRRVVRLINKIRIDVDGQQQEPIDTNVEGFARLFVFAAQTPDKPAIEEAARCHMANVTGDKDWNDRGSCKILTLEHHMAAKRMGFQEIFDAIYEVEACSTGLLDGKLPATRFYAKTPQNLVAAEKRGDKFAAAKVVRGASPLLTATALKEAPEPKAQLQAAKKAVEQLMSLWENGEPTCGAVLESVVATNLFAIPDSLKPILALEQIKFADEAHISDEAEADQLPERTRAFEVFLSAPFSQVAPYAQYISDASPYDTHQGVKGREFDRVMVLMDASETRGFMFDYEKLFGVKAPTAADEKYVLEGKETTLDRTRRLFYVTCSRARKSLAIVAYSEAPELVSRTMITNGWFDEREIVFSVGHEGSEPNSVHAD